MKKVIFGISFLFFFIGLGLFPGQQEAEKVPEVEVKDFGGFWYAYMNFHGPYSLLREKKEVFEEEFDKQGLKPSGPLFITFYNPPSVYKGYELRWAVCFKIDKGTKVKAPIKKRKAKKVKSVILMHTGPRKEIVHSFDRVQNYIKDNKYTKIWPAYELYHENPQGVEIVHPVKK